MKLKIVLPLMCLFITFLTGCSNSTSNYYLEGNATIENFNEIKFKKDGDLHIAQNVKLRRGDRIIVASKDEYLGFSSLLDKSGFASQENDYIEIRNEGIYNISINKEKNISFTKIDSTYSSVFLHFKDENKENIPFSKDEDFTFSLNDIDIRYLEEFYVQIDNETLVFKDVKEKDNQSNILVDSNDFIKSSFKGLFSFKIDFSNEDVLSISSNNIKEPNLIPNDSDSYLSLIDKTMPIYIEQGTRMTATQVKVENEVTTGKNYKESRNINEIIYEEENIASKEIVKNARFFNDTNYYEIREYENSNNKPTFLGKYLGEPSENENTSSTIVKENKEYISKENALKNIENAPTFQTTIGQRLKCVCYIQNLNSSLYSYEDSENYYKSLVINKATYTSIYGDFLEIDVSNDEIYNNGTNSILIKNNVSFKINEKGQLLSGKISNIKYEGDVLNQHNLSEIVPTYTNTLTFSFEYETRINVSDFQFDYLKYTISEITFLPTDFTCSYTFNIDDILHLNYYPSTAIDFNNLTLMEYDSSFIAKNAVSGWRGIKSGTTEVVIGTKYSDVSCRVELSFAYTPLKKLTIISSNSVTSFYEGGTYEFYVEPTSYADPVIEVSLSDKIGEFAVITRVDSEEEMIKTNKPTFSIKLLKATPQLTITVQSKHYPSITATYNLTIIASINQEKLAGNYYYKSLTDTFIKIYSDGTGIAQSNIGARTLHHFKYKILGSSIYLDNSETLSEFSASIELYNEKYNLYGFKSITILDKEGNYIFDYKYARYNKILPIMENTYTSSNGEATLRFEFNEYSFNDYNGIRGTAIINDFTTNSIYQFDWSPNSTSNEFSSLKVNDISIWSTTFVLSNFSIDSFQINIRNSSEGLDLNYLFIKD